MALRRLIGVSCLALASVSCGSGSKSDQSAPAPTDTATEFTFNEEIRAALTGEVSAIPSAMVVRVPVLADGSENVAGAELRSTSYDSTSGDVETAWASGSNAFVPGSDSRYLVVNPPNQQQQQVPSLPKNGGPGKQPARGKGEELGSVASSFSDVTTSTGAIAIGRRGVVVSGNYTRVEGSQGYSHNPYAYDSDDEYDNRSFENRRGSYNNGYGARRSYYTPSDYYMNYYRPVYRSRYGYQGYGAYWGYYGRPHRYVRGGYCYYAYPRPIPACGAYCSPRY